jgi:peptidoglycan hydrolase CwlO-like protein
LTFYLGSVKDLESKLTDSKEENMKHKKKIEGLNKSITGLSNNKAELKGTIPI